MKCKGYRREVGSERSMDQMCESMDKSDPEQLCGGSGKHHAVAGQP